MQTGPGVIRSDRKAVFSTGCAPKGNAAVAGAKPRSAAGRTCPRPASAPPAGTTDSWWGPFFPTVCARRTALDFYAHRFDAAELNAPFYRTPTPEAVQGWFDRTPDDFRFAWKASKFITHWKQLSERCDSLARADGEPARLLRHKAGPILFQLPPKMHAEPGAARRLPRDAEPARRYTFEFRHPSWYEAPIFDLLRRHDAALCLSDHAAAPAPWEVTASFVYIRGHGPTGRYHGNYRTRRLRAWAGDIRRWRSQGREVWCFFDNDVKSAAPHDAQRLLDALDAA